MFLCQYHLKQFDIINDLRKCVKNQHGERIEIIVEKLKILKTNNFDPVINMNYNFINENRCLELKSLLLYASHYTEFEA